MPQGFASYSCRNPCAGDVATLHKWFLSCANLPCRADPLDPVTDLSWFIADYYAPVEKIGSWVVLRRITNSSTATRNYLGRDNCEEAAQANFRTCWCWQIVRLLFIMRVIAAP